MILHKMTDTMKSLLIITLHQNEQSLSMIANGTESRLYTENREESKGDSSEGHSPSDHTIIKTSREQVTLVM